MKKICKIFIKKNHWDINSKEQPSPVLVKTDLNVFQNPAENLGEQETEILAEVKFLMVKEKS